MSKMITDFGKSFREKFNYTGKLSRECMGKELWNEYYKMRSKSVNESAKHKKVLVERKEARRVKTLERQAAARAEGTNYRKYCDDYTNIKNYDKAKADNFKGWQLHHILETHNLDGSERRVRQTVDDLTLQERYYKVPANELIFMETVDHRTLHQAKSRKLLDFINMKYFTNFS